MPVKVIKWVRKYNFIFPPQWVITGQVSVNNMLIFTDASYEDGRGYLGVAIIDTAMHQGRFSGAYAGILQCPGPLAMMAAFSTTSCIYGLELTASVLTILEVSESSVGRSVSFTIDKNANLYALMRGDSVDPFADALIAIFRYAAASTNIDVCLDRVDYSAKVSDGPPIGAVGNFPSIWVRNFPTCELDGDLRGNISGRGSMNHPTLLPFSICNIDIFGNMSTYIAL